MKKVQWPPLTPEQSAQVADNIGLAVKCTRMYVSRAMAKNVMHTDEFQWACFGLIEAAIRYKPEKGVKFSTYAFYWMKMRIFRGKAPFSSGYTPPNYRPAMCMSSMQSHDGVSGEGGMLFQNCIIGREPEPLDALVDKEHDLSETALDDAIRQALRFMPVRMRHCVQRIHIDNASLQVVGKELGLTRERIRQITNKGLERIRARLYRMGVRNKGDLARIIRGDVCLSS